MTKLTEVLADWGTNRFAQTIKREILALPPGTLPLQRAVTQGGIVQDGATDATLLAFEEDDQAIHCRLGIFFTETVGGCSCGDEPFTTEHYCEIRLHIDKASAAADFSLV